MHFLFSGKTTILYKLKLGEVVTTIPTIGFNVETVSVSVYVIRICRVSSLHELLYPLFNLPECQPVCSCETVGVSHALPCMHVPTMQVKSKKVTFTVWDVGGQDKVN